MSWEMRMTDKLSKDMIVITFSGIVVHFTG